MFQNVLSSIENVSVYPVISLILFMVVFTGVLIWALRLKREYINEMGNMPLMDDTEKLEKGNING